MKAVKAIETFNVIPALPPELERMPEIAHNLLWGWRHGIRALFRRLDPELWEQTLRNPVRMLGIIDQARLSEAAEDPAFLAHYNRVCQELDQYMEATHTWYRVARQGADSLTLAYFSAEFAITDCVPIYSGGLGVLAGDHLKSASDLGLPLVGVSLLYQQGYFRQYLNADGWQQEAYSDHDFFTMPVQPARLPGGEPLLLNIPLGGRLIKVQVWKAQVGRVPVYLLDTNVPGNPPVDRDITDRLYGGDLDMRMRQEIVLGIGGMRALKALGIRPTVCHMNEGHTAFLALERIRQTMEEHGLDFDQAREVTSAGQVFTTHTPVSAGNDFFAPALVDSYFASYYRELGLDRDRFLGLGRTRPEDPHEAFGMTVLALRLSAHRNGVSRLHERTAKRMWGDLWGEAPEGEVPIKHITNGVHVESWISHDLTELLDTYLGPRWREKPGDAEAWQYVKRIPPEELWRTHERRRERLVAFARRRLRVQLEGRGASPLELARADEALDPRVLTIGFARRFATYKRATLLLQDVMRLARMLNNPDRPVQLIFAGKAHPNDDPGKEMIRDIVHLSRHEEFRKRIVFLEDYDLDIARYMVQGADVWINTPRRPLEASGTSGMKAAANGVLNVSILDGWWDEAYSLDVGWAIGRGEEYPDEASQDQVESGALYELLETQVAPMFYERGADNLPRRWVARMKSAMRALSPEYNTHRMVREYTTDTYVPASECTRILSEDDFARARKLAAWKRRVKQHWEGVRVESVLQRSADTLKVGGTAQVQAKVRLGELEPDDVAVQLYSGRVDARGNIADPSITSMHPVSASDGIALFEGTAAPCSASGLHGYTVRVLPRHPTLSNAWDLKVVRWAG